MNALASAANGSTSGRLVEVSLETFDPTTHQGWDTLLSAHSGRSFFHSSAWAKVLRDSYGHRPFYLGQTVGGQLVTLLAILEVASPLTGKRGISLPFTDYCPVLSSANGRPEELFRRAVALGKERGWRYFECRGNFSAWPEATPSLRFYGHVVELAAKPEELFKRLESSVRRGIRKAETAGVQVEFRTDEEAMRTYFSLHTLTRKRHGLPPQPFKFFRNIARHVLGSGAGEIGIARHEGKPVAAAVYFHQGSEAIYKFGASDFRFQQTRPNNLLMWHAIKRYSELGLLRLHLGRTSEGNDGLRRFKMGFGAREETLEYAKFDLQTGGFVTEKDKVEGWFNHVFRAMPRPMLTLAGQILYPHVS